MNKLLSVIVKIPEFNDNNRNSVIRIVKKFINYLNIRNETVLNQCVLLEESLSTQNDFFDNSNGLLLNATNKVKEYFKNSFGKYSNEYTKVSKL